MDAHSNSPTMTSTTISQMTIHSKRAECAVFLWSRSMSSISCSTYMQPPPTRVSVLAQKHACHYLHLGQWAGGMLYSLMQVACSKPCHPMLALNLSLVYWPSYSLPTGICGLTSQLLHLLFPSPSFPSLLLCPDLVLGPTALLQIL